MGIVGAADGRVGKLFENSAMNILIVTAITNAYDDFRPPDWQFYLPGHTVRQVVFTDSTDSSFLKEAEEWEVYCIQQLAKFGVPLDSSELANIATDRLPKLFIDIVIKAFGADAGMWMDANIRMINLDALCMLEQLAPGVPEEIFFTHSTRKDVLQEVIAICRKRKVGVRRALELLLLVFRETALRKRCGQLYEVPLTQNGMFVVALGSSTNESKLMSCWRHAHKAYGPRDQRSLFFACLMALEAGIRPTYWNSNHVNLTDGTLFVRARHNPKK